MNKIDIRLGCLRVALRRVVLLTVGVGLAAVTNAVAATYTPNTLTDPDVSVSHHVNTADGHILVNGTNADTGFVSLRSAIIAANANAGADVVSLGSGTYQLQIAPILNVPFGNGTAHKAAYDDAAGSKYAQNGSLDVTGALTISGAGSAQTTIDGGNLDLILTLNPFNVANGVSVNTAGIAVTLSGLKLQHGKNASDDGTNGLAEGGAIWFDAGYNGAPSGSGTLTLNDVTLDHNTGNISGGAIVIWDGGTITISNSTLSNNTATFTPKFSSAYGGGIWATQPAPSGTLTLNNVILSGNQAVATGGGSGAGGALYSSTPGTTYQINIHGCSITGNTAPGDGGGLFGDKITIDSGTVISGNTATTGNGGGVEGYSQLTINAGTVITGNSAGLAGGGVSVGSGGSITKSTITNNTAGTAGGGVYILSGPDASTSTPAPSVTFCRISGNTATAGGSAVDSFDKLASVTDDWLGTNVPAAGDVGAGNAVTITNAHGSGPGGDDVYGGTVTITTAAPHGFVTGQVVAIDGVGISTYDGSSGAGTGGVTVTGPTTFTFPSHLATPGATQPPSSGGAASQFSSLLTASESGSTVTMTVDTYPHGLAVGQVVRIQGISGAAGYNGEFKVTGTPNATTFTFTAGQSGLPSLSSSRIGFAYPLVNNISAAAESGSTVTLTTNGSFGFAVGNLVSVAGVGAAGYNGTFLVTAVTPTSVSYANTQTGLAGATGGNVTKLADSLLELKASASPSTVRINQSSTVTASFLTDSANNSVSTPNLSTLIGQPITFGNPILGTLSGAQTAIQGSGTATVTFNAGGIGGFGHADATVDSGTATATIIVLQPPSIAKSFVPTFVPTNTDSALTLTVTNPNVVAIDASFTDDLSPAGLTVSPAPGVTNTCGGSVTAAAGSTSVSFSNASLPVGTCTVTANVRAAADGIKNNSVTIDSTIAGTGNTSLASLTVVNPPAIAKAFGAPTIPLNGATSLTFTITNSNTSTALAGLAFTDSLPAGLAVASPNNLSNTCGGTATATPGSGTVSLAGGGLGATASCAVSVDITGNTAGVKTNSVQVTSSNAGTGNTGTASIIVVAPPTIGKAFGASSIALNGLTSLTLTIQNPNSTVGLTGIGFVDTLPAGLAVATPSGLTNTCGGTATATSGSGSVSLSGGSAAANGSCAYSVNVVGTAAGAQNNTTGAVTSAQGGTGTTSNTATLTVVAPPTISKAFGASAIAVNGTTTLTLTLTNPAANSVAETGVAFTDNLPAGLVVATPSGLTSTCGGTATAAAGSGVVSLAAGTIAVNSTCTVGVNVTGTTAGVMNNTTGAVSSTTGGTGATSNTATLNVVAPETISKAFGSPTIPLNGSTSLSFTITNPNATPLTGVAATDNLPSGLVIATPNGLTGACGGGTITATSGASSLTLSGATLAASGNCTFSVNIAGTSAGVKNNTVTVMSTEAGAGSPGTASITVVAPPTITKAFGASSIVLNGSTSLTLTIQNPNATTTLTGIAFVDTLPAGLAVSTPSGLASTCGGTATAAAGSGSVSLTGGTISSSASCALSVNVTGLSAGTQNNTTGAITAAEGGTGATSNTATLVVSAPDLTVTKTHAANFRQGQTGAVYTITVTNSGSADTTGTVTVADALPAGLTATAFGGGGWSCLPLPSLSCSRSDVLAAGSSYPALTLTVNVALTAPGSVINTATVSGGGEGNTANDTVSDPTNIDSVTGNLYTLTQCRVLDTRKTAPIAAGATLTVAITGGFCGIPATATAVALNATATNEAAPGFLVLFPADQSRPMVSTLNFDPLKTRANNAFIRLAIDGSGAIKVFNASAGAIDLILDINAYFQ